MTIQIKPGSKADMTVQLLTTYNMDCAKRFYRGFRKSILSHTCDDDLEALNRYWRSQFARLDVDTTHIRLHLSQSADFNAWLHNFQRVVIPAILKYNLPVE